MGREEPRRCTKCGFQWWAVKAGKPAKLRWFEDSGMPFLTDQATARNVRRGHRNSEQLREWERYGLCARCGSQSIDTVKSRGFVPTALAEAAPPPGGPAPTNLAAPPHPPAPPAGPTAPGADVQPGDRVTVDQFGFRGKHGRVEGLRLDGTVDVRLDAGNVLVKRIPAKNLTHYRGAQPGAGNDAPDSATGFRPGDRVTVHVLGFRGKTGTVERIRPDGSRDVRLDDPSMVIKRIPATKLSAAPS